MKFRQRPKFSNSFYIADFYSYYNKHKKSPARVFEKGEYSKLVSAINRKIAKGLSEGQTFFLPYDVGQIELRKKKVTPYIDKEGKLVVPKSIIWSETKKLWEEDEEAREKKTMIYRQGDWAYILCYTHSCFKNHKYIMYFPNRSLKQALFKNIGKTILDAPLIWKEQQHLKI